MTRLKFDVTGVDPGGDFAVPKPGAYTCKIDAMEQKESQAGNEMIEVQYVIVDDGEFENSRLWDYIVLTENQRWKYRRFLEAVGAVSGRKEKGEIDLNKLIGKRVLVKVTNEDSPEYGKRARVGSVSRLSSADVEDEDLDEDEDDVEGEEELTYDDVMEMKKTELKELNEEEELGLRISAKTKLDDLRERVAAKLGLEEEEEDEDEDEEDEDEGVEEELTAEDIQAMDKSDLKALIEEEGLDVRVTKATKLPALRDRVAEELGLEDEEEEEDAEEEDEVEEVEDYAELGVADLRNEAKERGLNSKGSKAILVKRLEKDDEDTDAL